MWALARRAGRTRSWPVALKALMFAHGLLLWSDDAARLGRLPFDLSYGFSAFVRTYFHFLDFRSRDPSPEKGADQNSDRDLEQMERLQVLLDLLMQIRPYADGMEVTLIVEAMDCVVIEIFDVYSGICNGIACFLAGTLRQSAATRKGEDGEEAARRRRRGAIGMRILRKAVAQSSQFTAYFEACRALGVLNTTEFAPVERIPPDEKDIGDLERLVMEGIPGSEEDDREREKEMEEKAASESSHRRPGTVVTQE